MLAHSTRKQRNALHFEWLETVNKFLMTKLMTMMILPFDSWVCHRAFEKLALVKTGHHSNSAKTNRRKENTCTVAFEQSLHC